MKNKLLNIIGIVAVCVMVIIAFFITKGKTMQSGIKTENMDISVKPGNDFYDFATKGWRNNNPLPNDYTRPAKLPSFQIQTRPFCHLQ